MILELCYFLPRICGCAIFIRFSIYGWIKLDDPDDQNEPDWWAEPEGWIDSDGSAEPDDPNESDGWAELDGWMEGIGVLRGKAHATKQKTQKYAK